jgi:hypothetical protein
MKRFLRPYKSSLIMLAILMFLMYETRPAATKSNEAVYTAADFSFAGPDSLAEGWTTLRFENKGKSPHHILLVQLLDGKTRADFEAAVKDDPTMAKPSAWLKFSGGPNIIVPGEEGTALIKLNPGNYLLICVIPDPKGVPHFAQGMVKPLTVTRSKQSTEEPKAERVIELSDFSFKIPAPLKAGKHIIEVKNKGTQTHEVVLVKLQPNATAADFGRHFLPDAPAGAPPGKPIGGVVGIPKDGHAYFPADLPPGRYGLICFMPDTAGSGDPHFTKGMVADFTIPE